MNVTRVDILIVMVFVLELQLCIKLDCILIYLPEGVQMILIYTLFGIFSFICNSNIGKTHRFNLF